MRSATEHRRTSISAVTAVVVLLAVVAAAAVLTAAGCGGPSDEEVAFEQYLDDVRPALDDGLDALETLAASFELADQTEPPDFTVAARGCTEAAESWAAARDAAAAMAVPEDLKKGTDALVESFALEAALYAEMGTILSGVGSSLQDPVALDRLLTDLEKLEPQKVRQDVAALTTEWSDEVERVAEGVGVEMPAWLETWLADVEAVGERIQQL